MSEVANFAGTVVSTGRGMDMGTGEADAAEADTPSGTAQEFAQDQTLLRALEVPRELRLAVTMNGGVSLAVYIGGAAHEFNELTNEDGPYTALRRLVGYESAPIVDVITGTSAGGINATALALAQSNAHDTDLSVLKLLWIEHGQIGALLRQPFRDGPPSLLRGDDYFYPRILAALHGLTTEYARSTTDIDLAITTTLLTPVHQKRPDDLGTATVQPQHAGLFNFTGRPNPHGDVQRDDFSETEVSQTVKALALAARASAGFPVAFEPTFIPVNHGEILSDRPDMARYADWVRPDDTPLAGDLSRFAIDGGVLANTPTQPALSGIRRHTANDRLVRRALVLVHPHATPGKTVHNSPDMSTAPPSLTATLGGVFRASSSTGSRAYVEEIEQHNELALKWRDGRLTAMREIPEWQVLRSYLDPEGPSWRLFHALRLQRGAYVMAHQIRTTTTVPLASIVRQARQVLSSYIEDESSELPFLPSTPPSVSNLVAGQWQWGLDFAVGITQVAIDLLREMLSTPAHEWQQLIEPSAVCKLPGLVSEANEARRKAVNARVVLDEIGEREERAAARRDARREDGPELNDFDQIRLRLRGNARLYRLRMGPTLTPPGIGTQLTPSDGSRVDTEIRQNVCAPLLQVLNDVADVLTPHGDDGRYAATLLGKNPLQGAANPDELLQRLMSVEVLAYLLTEESSVDSTTPSMPVEFYQLSAQVEQHFAREFNPDDKLAGMSVNRFGAFLKRSWRANDWIWGRLDGIKMIMLILLSPVNVRAMSRGGTIAPERIVRNVCVASFGPKPPSSAGRHSDQDHLDPAIPDRPELHALYGEAVAEVTKAIAGDSDKPLTDLCSLAAYGFQCAAAQEEVPWLATTVIYDKEDGAAGARSSALLQRFTDVIQQPLGGRLSDQSYEYLKLFVDSRIGQESVEDELPGDLMIRTAARAVAASATMITSERAGFSVAKPVARVIRGAVAVPYWAVTGLSHRGSLARVVAATVLAFGASLIALSLIAPLSPPLNALVPTLGAGSVVTIFVYAAMRSRSIVHGAALLGLFIPLIGLAVNRMWGRTEIPSPQQEPTPSTGFHLSIPDGLLAIGCVLILVFGVVLAANINAPVSSPMAQIYFVVGHIKPCAAWKVIRRALRPKYIPMALGAGVLTVLVIAGGAHLWWVDGPLRHRWHPQHVFPVNHMPVGWAQSHGALANTLEIAVTALPFVFIMAHGWYVGWRNSARLRPRQMTNPQAGRSASHGSPADTVSAEHVASPSRLVDPAGLSVAWSAAYGIIYILLAIGMLCVYGQHPPDAVTAAATVAYVIGIAFSIIAVHVIPIRRERGLIRKLALALPRGMQADAAEFDSEVVKALNRIGDDSRYLVEQKSGPQLSKHGRRVALRALEEQSRPSISALLTGAVVVVPPPPARAKSTEPVASSRPAAQSSDRS